MSRNRTGSQGHNEDVVLRKIGEGVGVAFGLPAKY